MRTTLRIDDHLFRRAKKLAAATGRTLTQVVEDALRLALATSQEAPRREAPVLKTCGGRGVQPGVDLDDSASLMDLMEGRG